MYTRYAELRDALGLTDYKVSKDTGISKSTLSEWKRGEYTPKADKLTKLADYFHKPQDYFVRVENAKN